jgi:hypothetical protein
MFGASETTFMGYRISHDGIDTKSRKVEAMTLSTTPVLVRELHMFQRLAGYYRRLIEQFTYKSPQLPDLLNVARANVHGPNQHQAHCDTIKGSVTIALVPVMMGLCDTFILCTDRSDYVLGLVLAQRQLWKGRLVKRPLEIFFQTS